MTLTIYNNSPEQISTNEVETDEELFFTNPIEKLNIVYHVNTSSGKNVITSLGSVSFCSPFENRRMTPYSYYKAKNVIQPYDDPNPAYIKDHHAFVDKSVFDENLQNQQEQHPDWDAPENYSYSRLETHNGTTYVGLPFDIIPLMYLGGEYASLDISLYTDENITDRSYTITNSICQYPKVSPCSDIEEETLSNSNTESLFKAEFDPELVETFDKFENMIYTSEHMSNVRSISPRLADLNFRREFEKNPTQSPDGFATEEELNELFQNKYAQVNYFEPIYSSLYYTTISKPKDKTDWEFYGVKDALNYFEERDIPVLEIEDSYLKILLKKTGQIPAIENMGVQSVTMDTDKGGLVAKVDTVSIY